MARVRMERGLARSQSKLRSAASASGSGGGQAEGVLRVVHGLGEGRAHGGEMRDGAAVMGRFPPALSKQPRCGDVSVDQGYKGGAEGCKLVGEHRVLAG